MSKNKNDAAVMAQFEENAKRPFGLRDKIGYAAGDFANDLTFVIAALFMMKFYTDIMGVSAALVGTLMMAAKVVDAFTDVAMGQVVDRSRYTAKGKFAPWVRRFAGPVAVASFLIFAPYFADKPMGFKVFWMFFTYILWGSVCYTGVNIPYGSMASAMSDKPEERAMLSNWRTIGATVAQIGIVVILPMVVYTTDAEGHQVLSGSKTMLASGVCSILAVLVYLICYHLSTERVKMEAPEEKKNVFEDRSDEIMETSITARLLSFPNVIITSHQGFFTYEALDAISETTLNNAMAFTKGERTGNEVEIE